MISEMFLIDFYTDSNSPIMGQGREINENMNEESKEIIRILQNEVVVIEEITQSRKTYEEAIERFYDYIKKGFEFEELRKCPVNFTFTNSNRKIIQLELRHFVTNLMMWLPIVLLDKQNDLGEKFIIDCRLISSKTIKGYIDELIVKPYRTEVSNKKMNKVLHDMLFNLSRISTDFNAILGLSMNVETFIDMSKRNKRFNEIIRTKIPDEMQPNEIESHLKALTNEQIRILQEDPEGNFIQPILNAGTGIKAGQFKEFAVNQGLKPDIDGKTIPIAVNSNFIVGGLENIVNYYIDALGGRKAQIMNSTVMGRAGYFARMVMLLTTSIVLGDEKDCGTLNPIEFEIKSKEHLYRLKGRNYRPLTSRTYRILKGDETELIGQKILVRSPITCASEKICLTCYGELYHTNKDFESIGGYAAAKITEPLSQSILSSKHLLATDSEKVEFNEEFDQFFSISANEINIREDFEDPEKRYSLIIMKDEIETIEEFDETEFNSYVPDFHVLDKQTGELIHMKEKHDKELYLSPELRDKIKKKRKERIELPIADLEEEMRLFVAEISNNELTKPLYDIMHLMNNEKKRKGYDTLDQVAQRMLDLLIISEIKSDSIHGEIMLRPLVRDKNDILEIPDFRSYSAADEYQILTVMKALQFNPSVVVSLSFQYISKQLISPITFHKTKPSYLDAFFEETPGM